MKKFASVISMSVLLGLSGAVLAAGDPAAGKARAAVCVACHGADGIGTAPTYPNLKGQKEAYLVKQLKAFRDGTRTDTPPIMSGMAKSLNLTDTDIDNLAAYFSSL
jgi:cytochrome c553